MPDHLLVNGRKTTLLVEGHKCSKVVEIRAGIACSSSFSHPYIFFELKDI